MADKIKVNIRPYDGEYDFDLEDEPLNTREWHWIKKLSGYLPATIDEGWKGADPDLILAFAVIALVRGGRVTRDEVFQVADRLMDAPVDGASIAFIGEPQEVGGGSPPDEPAETPEQSSEPQKNGGGSSPPTLASWDNGQSRTGTEGSVRSAISVPATSET